MSLLGLSIPGMLDIFLSSPTVSLEVPLVVPVV